MKLEEIQESWSSDSQIDDTELDNESLKIPELHHKYFRIFSDEKLKLVRMYSKQKELRRLKWLYYTGKLDQETLENFHPIARDRVVGSQDLLRPHRTTS